LTIILAWRQVGSPQTDAGNIVTFDGLWTEYCRQPLMWLGLPDPATTLISQVQNDPDTEALGRLLFEWYEALGSAPTTVRKAVAKAGWESDLLDALRDFPVEEKGSINNNKLGWVLKKNANRIVNGMEFRKSSADGRTAWQVIKTKNEEAK
jgi:hypothetical protein